MRKAGGGAIVNISSMNGLAAGPMAIAYHGTKAAVHLITKVAALEYAEQGIRVNSLHPGFTMTSTAAALPKHVQDKLAGNAPLKRAGTPEEMAYGSLYLCSDEASYVTGTALVIDGGVLARA
jgi:NAD(P)-dependent dehydrogenase (short-subunit alcohol dehydrogenase family)